MELKSETKVKKEYEKLVKENTNLNLVKARKPINIEQI